MEVVINKTIYFCQCGCGKEATVYRKKPRKYFHGHRAPYKHSEETKKKIGIANKGYVMSIENRKKTSERLKGISFFKGRKHTEESKKKISESIHNSPKHHKRISVVREYCDSWYDKEYKKSLKKNTCESCGMNRKTSLLKWNESLSLRHKDGDKRNNHPENICTLCKSCHAKEDWKIKKERVL